MEPLSSFVSFLAGLGVGWLGHAQALSRDKRKERNEAAEPVRAWLLSQVDDPQPWAKELAPDVLDKFQQCLPKGPRQRFQTAWTSLDHVRACTPSVSEMAGILRYGDPERVRVAVRACLPFTERV